MSQTVLTEEAGDTLRHVVADIDGALRYIDGEAIGKEHVKRWAEDLQKVLDGRIVRKHHGERAPRASRPAAVNA